MKNENVMVVSADILKPTVTQGFSLIPQSDTLFKLILANARFMERPEAEVNFDFWQPIPYVLVRHAGRYLLLQRTKKQGEQRLHGKHSLGVGGHVNDATLMGYHPNVILASAYRELEEEIRLEFMPELVFRGTLRDESNEVGRVHYGLVYVAEAKSPNFEVGEPDLMTAEWKTVEELREFYPKLEGWSQLLFGAIMEGAL